MSMKITPKQIKTAILRYIALIMILLAVLNYFINWREEKKRTSFAVESELYKPYAN